MAADDQPWLVKVDDNFHYMDESYRYVLGSFPSYEEAERACQALIDRWLSSALRPGIAPEQLWEQYRSFGEDPFVVGPEPPRHFSAWGYAKARCQELAG